MEGHCSTGQSPQWAVVPMLEEEEEEALIFDKAYFICVHLLVYYKSVITP